MKEDNNVVRDYWEKLASSFCIFFPLFFLLFIFFHIFTAFDKADFDVEIYPIPFDHDGIHVTLANVQASKILKKSEYLSKPLTNWILVLTFCSDKVFVTLHKILLFTFYNQWKKKGIFSGTDESFESLDGKTKFFFLFVKKIFFDRHFFQ